MSPEDMVPAPDSCSTDVAAYALGALDSADADAFERHLRTCAVCPVELTGFQQVVDGIACSAPPCDAPRALRRRVMAAVESERRGASPAAARRGASPATARRRRWRLPVSGPGLVFGSGVAFAIAAIVVVVIALPGRMGNRTIQATVNGAGSASLVVSSNHSQLVIHHVTAPPKGKIYEVWLQHGNRTPSPVTTALFSVNRAGDASVDVPGSLYGVSHVLVTPEPPGGSRRPTHAPVITAAL